MIYCEWHFTIGKLDIRVRFKISVDCTQIRPANREVPISWNSSSVLRTKWNLILYVTKSCVEPFSLFEHGDLYCWIFINFKLFAKNKLFTEMSDLPAKLKLVSKQRRKLMSKYYNASFASRIMAFGNSYCRSFEKWICRFHFWEWVKFASPLHSFCWLALFMPVLSHSNISYSHESFNHDQTQVMSLNMEIYILTINVINQLIF